MWEPIETLANAQQAVSRKLTENWLGFARASSLPALAAVAVLIWMVEAYWASTAFLAGQIAVLVCAGALVLFLSSLAVGRMIRIGLKVDSAPAAMRALKSEPADARLLGLFLGFVALIALASVLETAAQGLVLASFVAPGSGKIAQTVLACAQTLILLGLYYLLGRSALFLPASLALPACPPAFIWRATEGHGAILFIVGVAVPWAALCILAGPAVWWIGAFPWPGPDDFAHAESLALALRERLYLVAPSLFLGIAATWALLAAGLCAAWEALLERGAFDIIEASG